MSSIAEQLRFERHRRDLRRRVVVSALIAVSGALIGGRLVAGAGADLTGAEATARLTTSTTVAAGSQPTRLVPGLVDAFQRARAEAARAGHQLTITSGFRTADEQAVLLDAEVTERGSLEEALWWVFPPDRSMHVQGLAIDVGDGPAADWLEVNGARFGLCRTLDWEWWHFEWREQWEAASACPAPARTPQAAPGP